MIYPTAGLQLYMVPDLPLLSACFRAYNDWLVDFCQAAPERLRGIAMINVEDVDEAVRELTRARQLGLAGGMITVAPAEDRSYDHTMYEPFWAAAQDLDAPISLHVATNRPTPYSDAESNRTSRASLLANADYWVRVALGHLILEGCSSGIRGCASARPSTRSRGSRTSSIGSTTPTRSAPGARTGSAIAPTCCPSDFFRQLRLPELPGGRDGASAIAR